MVKSEVDEGFLVEKEYWGMVKKAFAKRGLKNVISGKKYRVESINICLICDAELGIPVIVEEWECYFCHEKSVPKRLCPNDHFVCDTCWVKHGRYEVSDPILGVS